MAYNVHHVLLLCYFLFVPHYKGWLPVNEAARAHAVNEHGAWQMAGKFACRFKYAHWGSLCWAFNISSSISALEPLLISIPTLLVVHIAEDYELLHSTLTKSLHCMRSISANSRTLYCNTGCAHTSCTHFNWIFELLSSLRSNYALYHDTMPLRLFLYTLHLVYTASLIGYLELPPSLSLSSLTFIFEILNVCSRMW